MAKTFGVLIAIAITLGVTEAAPAQPEPDPAPVPAPAPEPATAPPPASTPAPNAAPASEGRRRDDGRRGEKKQPARKPKPREAEVAPTVSHPSRAEAGTTVAATAQLLASAPPVVQARAPADAGGSFSSAAGVGLLAYLGAAILGLAFATLPPSILGGVSERLVERRKDIGLAMALMIAASAAIFVFLLAL